MTVVAMSIGLDNSRGGRFGKNQFEKDNRFPSQSKKKGSKTKSDGQKWKPSVTMMVAEIKRRKKEYYTLSKGLSDMTKHKAFDWLLAQPINDSTHIKWVQNKMRKILDATIAGSRFPATFCC